MSKDNQIRQRIVEFSRERFFTMGFSKVTMDELSQQLGISKKTMYEHFHSKDELLDAVFDMQMHHVASSIRAITQSNRDFIAKLYALWEFIGHFLCRVSPQFREDIRRFRPDIWKRIEEMRAKTILGNISKMIDEGIRQKLVREDTNRDAMVLMYLSAIQGVVNPAVLAENSFSMEEAFKTIMTVYLDGILTDRARKQFHSQISHQSEAQSA